MSGYRSLHREQVESNTAVWQIQSTRFLSKKSNSAKWRLWTATSEGFLKGYLVEEKDDSSLDASALKMECTHTLGSKSQLGCTQLSWTRNYVGDDETAGDVVLASLSLAGQVAIYNLPYGMDDVESNHQELSATHTFQVETATGTALLLGRPTDFDSSVLMVAVACLDGTVSMISTGMAIPNVKNNKSLPDAGTVLEVWGSSVDHGESSSIVLVLIWDPSSSRRLAVGRQDGRVELLANQKSQHRWRMHESPVRALCFTTDGHLLISGSDEGMVCLWDVVRGALVRHLVQAHTSWVLDLCALDARRFASCGADHKVHIWNVGDNDDKPVHSFQTDDTAWTLALSTQGNRMISATETGWLQVYSIDK